MAQLSPLTVLLSLSSTVGVDFYSQVVGIPHFWLTYRLVTIAYSELGH